MYEPAYRIPLFGEIVAGATRRTLTVWVDDETGTPVNLTGGNATLQGRSNEVPLTTINTSANFPDPIQGKITFTPGSIVTQAAMTTAGVKVATYICRIVYTDIAGKKDYTEPFRLRFVQDPLQAL